MYLAKAGVQDIWGVGGRLAPKLRAEGVATALALRQFSSKRASQLMGVHGRQLVAELNNISCHTLERIQKPQTTITRGRQFGMDTSELSVVESAIASLGARAAARLRRGEQLARGAAIIIRTNRHKPGYRALTKSVTFVTPTSDTGTICAALIKAVEELFNSHEQYHKADVMLFDLLPNDALQLDIFDQQARPAGHEASRARMAAVDRLNDRFGKGHLIYAAERLSDAWRPRHNLGSPRYTSAWGELPEARVV